MTSDQTYRVMVVDDSAVIRGLLSRALEADRSIEVVASVSNGEQAITAVTRHDVDVVVLDIEMPVMDGLTALPKIIAAKPDVQVIMASTLTRKNAEISLKALQAGAAEYVTKPSSNREMQGAREFNRELTTKVKALGAAARAGKPARARRSEAVAKSAPKVAKPPAEIVLRHAPITPPSALAIGSSTGGPQALINLLSSLDGNLKLPILITQHMPATFTALLAQHISRSTPFTCSEGASGDSIRPGHIYLAPGGYHMEVEHADGGPVVRLNQNPPENFCRPAVDPMLRSLSRFYGARLMAVILTGMGSDGMLGCKDVVAADGSVIAQDEASSVVWGMPGAVATAGLCSAVLPLPEIAPYLCKLLMRSAA